VATTATAANVLHGAVSHDLGGFHGGNGCPGDGNVTNSTGSELYLRWLQFGAAAPVFRTHGDHTERRIWLLPHFVHMRDAMHLRAALVPTLYTAARAHFDAAVAPVRPLYHDWPGDEAVYDPAVSDRQYVFCGVIAAPITVMPGAPVAWSVYLPAGEFSNWNGTKTFAGPQTTAETYDLGDVPLFPRAGALLALAAPATASAAAPVADPLVWAVWPGASDGSFEVYEDDGTTEEYQANHRFAVTRATFSAAAASFTLTVAPAAGARFAGFPVARRHALQLRGAGARPVASVTANGSPVPRAAPGVAPGWYVVAEANHSLAAPAGALVVVAGASSTNAATTIVVTFTT